MDYIAATVKTPTPTAYRLETAKLSLAAQRVSRQLTLGGMARNDLQSCEVE